MTSVKAFELNCIISITVNILQHLSNACSEMCVIPCSKITLALPLLSILISQCCHLSHSLGATPVPTEWFNDLLNSTTPRWLCIVLRCLSCSRHQSREPKRTRKQTDITELLSNYSDRNSPPVGKKKKNKNKEQVLKRQAERSWLLNRCMWLFQVWCRRNTGKEMRVKHKTKVAGLSKRQNQKTEKKHKYTTFFCSILLTKWYNVCIPYRRNGTVLGNI